MRVQAARSLALASLLVTTVFAGCFDDNDPESDDVTHAIARAWTLHVDNEAMERLESAADPFAELESMLDATLSIRVARAGDYTLAYTSRLGEARNETLTGLQPGVAHVVRGVDPFAGARLLDGADVLAERRSVEFDGLQVGDLPLGLRTGPGAASSYDYDLDVHTAFQVNDLASAHDGGIDVNALNVRIDLPLRGTVNWSSPPADAAGTRIDVNLRLSSANPEGGIALATADATTEGGPMTGGVEVPTLGLAADGALSLWFEDDRLSAIQAQGGGYGFSPTVYVWAEGADAARFGEECAGKTRADRCQPTDIPRVDERMAPGSRETFDDEAFAARSEDERQIIRFMDRLFGLDMAEGDQWTLSYAYDSREDAYERSDFRMTLSLETKVAEKESVTVAAGTFDAFRIAQAARLQVDADSLSEYSGYDPTTGQSNYSEVARGLSLDETVARQTLWLHAETFAPLKLEAETPIDADALATRIIGSLTDEGWRQLGFERIPPEDLAWTVNAVARVEALTLDTQARFAPAVGIGLASALTGAGSILGITGFWFPMRSYDESVPVVAPYDPGTYPVPATPTATPPPGWRPPPPHPTEGMALVQSGPITNGSVRLMVDFVSNATWGELTLHTRGSDLEFEQTCGPLAEARNGTYFVCRGDQPVGPDEGVWEGDVITLGGVAHGDVVEAFHGPSGLTWWAGKLY